MRPMLRSHLSPERAEAAAKDCGLVVISSAFASLICSAPVAQTLSVPAPGLNTNGFQGLREFDLERLRLFLLKWVEVRD